MKSLKAIVVLQTWFMDKSVPDADSFSIFIPCTFHLVGRSGGSKFKGVWESLFGILRQNPIDILREYRTKHVT